MTKTKVKKTVGLSSKQAKKPQERRSSNKGVRSNRRAGSRTKAKEETRSESPCVRDGKDSRKRDGKKNVELRNGRRTTVKAALPPHYVRGKSKSKSIDDPIQHDSTDDQLVRLDGVEIDYERPSQDYYLDTDNEEEQEKGEKEEVDEEGNREQPEQSDDTVEREQETLKSKTEEAREAFASRELTFDSALKTVDAAFYALGKFVGENTCHTATTDNICMSSEGVSGCGQPSDTISNDLIEDTSTNDQNATHDDNYDDNYYDDDTNLIANKGEEGTADLSII